MATYTVTDPTTGRTLKLTGDSPPSEQELTEIFDAQKQAQEPQERPFISQESLIPEEVSGLGQQLRGATPEALRPGLDMATQTLKGAAIPGVGQFASQQAIDKPEQTALTAGAILSPIGAGLSMGTRALARTKTGQEFIEDTSAEASKGFDKPIPTDIVGRAQKAILTPEAFKGGIEVGGELVAGIGGAAAELKLVQAFKSGAQKLSGRLINDLVKPKNKDFLFGKDPGGEVARQGIKANSLEQLGKKINTKIGELSDELKTLLSRGKNATKKINANSIFDVIGKTIDDLSRFPKINSSKIKALKDLSDDIIGIVRDKFGRIVSKGKFSELSPAEVTELKRLLGEQVKWAATLGDDVSSAVAKTIRKVYGTLDALVDDAVPASAGLNRSMSNLISARNAAINRIPATQRQAIIGLLPRLTAIAGGGIAGSTGGPLGALGGAVLAGLGEKAITSPAVTTRVASGLAGLASKAGTRLSRAL